MISSHNAAVSEASEEAELRFLFLFLLHFLAALLFWSSAYLTGLKLFPLGFPKHRSIVCPKALRNPQEGLVPELLLKVVSPRLACSKLLL
jgi:hypothetical protein